MPIDREKLQTIEAIQAPLAQHAMTTNRAVALAAGFALLMLIVLLISHADIL
jgi:hypothetical protein